MLHPRQGERLLYDEDLGDTRCALLGEVIQYALNVEFNCELMKAREREVLSTYLIKLC